MYAKFRSETVLDFWKAMFCLAQFERCERYKRFCDGKDVPPEMLPNGKTLE
jgi:hypothetical protein